MIKTLFLFAGIFATTGLAQETYRFEEILGTENAFREIVQSDKSAEDAVLDAPRVPFLSQAAAFPEASEPDDLLESSPFDYAETDSEALAKENSETLFVDMGKSALPIESRRITSPYGFRHIRIHKGLDIGLKKGDTVRAAFPGTVARVRYERRGYGHYVVLKHEGCGVTRTVYAHLSKAIVKVGDAVAAGTPIGLGGSTGRSTGPHLHFEMRLGDMPLDPTRFFDFKNGNPVAEKISIPREDLQNEYAALEKEASKHRYHRVRPGDTLGKIARRYHTSVKRLQQLNGLKKNSILRIGRLLRCS